MTDEQVEELAGTHGVKLGMRPPAQLVMISEDTMAFRVPPGFTPYGAQLMEFARAIQAAERERCARVCEAASVRYGDYFSNVIRKGEE